MTVPSSLALTTIADGGPEIAAPLRNNFSAIQTAVNALIDTLSDEAAYYTTGSDDGPTGVTGTGDGDLLHSFPAGDFDNVKYYWEISGAAKSAAANDTVFLRLHDSGSPGTLVQEVRVDTHATAGKLTGFSLRVPFTPTAGTHTYTLRWRAGGAGAYTLPNSLVPLVMTLTKA